jgi:hypothetical protein
VRTLLALRPALVKPDVLAMGDVALVVRFTRNWIHYGFLGHTVVCILVAAVEGLLGR